MWSLRVLNYRAAITLLALASVLLTAQAPLPEPVTETETELGLAVCNEITRLSFPISIPVRLPHRSAFPKMRRYVSFVEAS
jgi:hypothetical protein